MRVTVRAACLALCALASCDAAAEFEVETRAVGLYSGPAPDGTDGRVGALRFLAGFEIVGGDDGPGGLSGMAVAPEGDRMLAVTDRGRWVHLTFDMREGLPVGVADMYIAPLATQAEALLVEPDGVLVAFEEDHRIDRWPTPSALEGFPVWTVRAPHSLPLPDAVQDAGGNSGIEAMTRLADGRLLILLEGEAAPNDRQVERQGWILERGSAQALTLKTPGGFRPTDAATLPDGDVLVLLRCWASCGFNSEARLVRIPTGDISAGAVLTGRTVAHLAPPMTVDNYEGLDVGRDAAGRTLVYLLSDDNFNPRQRSLFMLFALDDSRQDQG